MNRCLCYHETHLSFLCIKSAQKSRRLISTADLFIVWFNILFLTPWYLYEAAAARQTEETSAEALTQCEKSLGTSLQSEKLIILFSWKRTTSQLSPTKGPRDRHVHKRSSSPYLCNGGSSSFTSRVSIDLLKEDENEGEEVYRQLLLRVSSCVTRLNVPPLRDPPQTTTTSRLRPPSRSKSPDAESCLSGNKAESLDDVALRHNHNIKPGVWIMCRSYNESANELTSVEIWESSSRSI
ncbi:hypothetical protein DAPPUDRAFT_241592 [Daphnia pulex]|uniref:Uncharacterized protein n=1 Tax=Daphnia pulex TaxID=6669 RepID=E9GEM3_DAPPU|nr:hypothetical protein DAPPUDRAFT_241592 [Daphnia pulex]|eukprot:EFX82057.1 hypothetical protein DAPPUDRAFT_241592 [Daphnia pulex]